MGLILTTYESRDYIVTESAISDHEIKIETLFFPTRYVSSPKSLKLSHWLNDVSHCKDPDYLWSAWKKVPNLFSKIMVLWYFYHGTIKKTSKMQVQDIQDYSKPLQTSLLYNYCSSLDVGSSKKISSNLCFYGKHAHFPGVLHQSKVMMTFRQKNRHSGNIHQEKRSIPRFMDILAWNQWIFIFLRDSQNRHPWSLTWNLKNKPGANRTLVFQPSISRSRVSSRGVGFQDVFRSFPPYILWIFFFWRLPRI